MGTGAVYVTLAGLKPHPGYGLTVVETVFYFLNMVLFLLNTSTLLLQMICRELLLTSIAALDVSASSLPKASQETHYGSGKRNFRSPGGFVICYYHHRHYQLWRAIGACHTKFCLCPVLVSPSATTSSRM